jgi:hypothetical protein
MMLMFVIINSEFRPRRRAWGLPELDNQCLSPLTFARKLQVLEAECQWSRTWSYIFFVLVNSKRMGAGAANQFRQSRRYWCSRLCRRATLICILCPSHRHHWQCVTVTVPPGRSGWFTQVGTDGHGDRDSTDPLSVPCKSECLRRGLRGCNADPLAD